MARKISIETAKKRTIKLLGELGEKYSEMKSIVDEGREMVFIRSPWQDDSLAFVVFKNGIFDKKLFDTLKEIDLPPELSAIYHKDIKSLEVIWTSYKLPAGSIEIKGRSFEFSFNGSIRKCRFSKSSDRLLYLAKSAAYLSVSDSGFRNLQSFSQFARSSDGDASDRLGEPLSFYIDDIDLEDASYIDIVKHVNFYLKYYDAESPYVLIHEKREKTRHKKKRYIDGEFPDIIVSRNLNPNLLSLWLASFDQDITTRFLLYYRILEYVTSLHVQGQQRFELRKVLASPSSLSRIDETLDAVARIVREDKLGEVDRYIKMFDELVDPGKIWSEISGSLDCFSEDICFEGGLEIKAVVTKDSSFETFRSNGPHAVARALRHIRHGLTHGGEAQAGRIILPTTRNMQFLLPWVHVAMVAAGEVVLFEHMA